MFSPGWFLIRTYVEAWVSIYNVFILRGESNWYNWYNLFILLFSVQIMDEEKEMLLEYKLKKVVLLVLCPRCQVLLLCFGYFFNMF